jgi:threonine synthase
MTAEQLQYFRATGSLTVEPDQLDAVTAVFDAARVDDNDTLGVIAETYAETGLLIDPHTAVGLGAARLCRSAATGPLVALATAHPAKFPDAVEKATGVRPPLPAHLADLFDRPERLVVLPNDLAVVERFVAGV